MSSSVTHVFESGQCLVTPLHGVCEVVERTELEILGRVQLYYVLRPLDEPGLLKLPQNSLEPGVRPLLEASDMRALLETPRDDAEVPYLRPHQRLDAWLGELKQGCPRARRRVLWEMARVRERERKLTAVEEALWERVHSAFRREIVLVLGLDEEAALQLVNELSGMAVPT